jgi:hypothetical protein
VAQYRQAADPLRTTRMQIAEMELGCGSATEAAARCELHLHPVPT